MIKAKVWSGRFDEPVSDLVKRYTASVAFDQRLAEFDIEGSLAHARMLAHVRILTAEDLAAIERGLEQVRNEIRTGAFAWSIDAEDVHLAHGGEDRRQRREKLGGAQRGISGRRGRQAEPEPDTGANRQTQPLTGRRAAGRADGVGFFPSPALAPR